MAGETISVRGVDPLEVRIEDDLVNGRRLTAEDISAKLRAEYEAGKPEELLDQKKAAYQELIALGLSEATARLLAHL